ncbi:MAG: hypothetical protein RI928_1126 [Pseudomonadota bacterium]
MGIQWRSSHTLNFFAPDNLPRNEYCAQLSFLSSQSLNHTTSHTRTATAERCGMIGMIVSTRMNHQ